MADRLNGLIFSEFLVDNSPFAAGFDTDGDGDHNKSDEYVELQNTSGSTISLDGYQLWSDDAGLLYDFGPGDTVAPGQTATVVGEYSGTPPAGFYDAGLSDGDDFLEDGEGSNNDTIYLVDTATGNYISFSYGDPVQSPSPPPGFPGTNQIGGGESLNSDGPNGVAFVRDTNGDWEEGAANPGAPGVACYAKGTLIQTPDGPRPVERLRPGDSVVTRDNGVQPVRWVRTRVQNLQDIQPKDKPVLIKADALGRCRPLRDLIVSPQHRILVGGAWQFEKVFDHEAFAAAKFLTSQQGIRHMNGKQQITWVHFACDRHEVVTANGCQSESLLLGPVVFAQLTALERKVVTSLFGVPASPDTALNGPVARVCLTQEHVRRRFWAYRQKRRQQIGAEIAKWDADLAAERFGPRQTVTPRGVEPTKSFA